MPEKAYDVKVSGKVQRIGYSRFILENAQELELSGYVRNVPDGSVAIFVQGEENLVKQFLDKVKEAPLPVVVKSFEVKAARSKSRGEVF